MPRSDPPNMLVVTAHDIGRRLGCYGADVQTPTLDRLAAEGTTFENAFAASTTCAPSRASLDTGLLPHNHGLFGHPGAHGVEKPWFGWEMDDVDTTPTYLGALGYTSYLCGLQHETTSVERLGYDHVQQHETVDDPDKVGSPISARAVADEVTDVLERERDRDGPFYIQANPHNVHAPFSTRAGGHREDPVPGFDPVAPDDVEVPRFLDGTPDVREALVHLEEDLYELDYAVGRMLDALESNGMLDETLVLFTSDHGLPFAGGAKSTVFDDGIGISLIARLPGEIDPGSREETLVSNVDVLPTLIEYAGGEPPSDLDGQSLRPVVRGVADDGRDAVVSEMTHRSPRNPYSPVRAIRTAEYKYVRNFWFFDLGSEHFNEPLSSDPDGYYGSLENRRGIRPEEELYDLTTDPTEEENVINEPEYAEVGDRLRERLRARLLEDDAPITQGHIPPVGFDTEF
ncbi:MAG: sulfatase [Halobacteriales archaeon]